MDFYKLSWCNFVRIASHLKLGEIKQSLLIALKMTWLLTHTHFTAGVGLGFSNLVFGTHQERVWERRMEACRWGWGMEGSACGKSVTDHAATISSCHLPASILPSEAPLDRRGKKDVVHIYNGKSLSYYKRMKQSFVATWMDLEITILGWNKSNRERQITSLICGSWKKYTNKLIYKTEIESQT